MREREREIRANCIFIINWSYKINIFTFYYGQENGGFKETLQ